MEIDLKHLSEIPDRIKTVISELQNSKENINSCILRLSPFFDEGYLSDLKRIVKRIDAQILKAERFSEVIIRLCEAYERTDERIMIRIDDLEMTKSSFVYLSEIVDNTDFRWDIK